MTAFQRSKKRSSFTGQLFIYGLAALLMVFTGYRTFDLISRTLPEEAHILAAIAILCFDGGIAIWLFYFSRMAKSNEQIGISGILTVLDFLGMGTLFVIHTIISQNFFSTDWNPGGLVVVTTSFGVLSNVAGIIAVHFFDPDEKLARARRDAEAEVNSRAVELVANQTDALAGEIAPDMARGTLQRARENLSAGLPPRAPLMAFPAESPGLPESPPRRRIPQNGREPSPTSPPATSQ